MRCFWVLGDWILLLAGAIAMGQFSGLSGASRPEPVLALPVIEDQEARFHMPRDREQGLQLAPGTQLDGRRFTSLRSSALH
jgi:hypothetical protein